MDTILKSLTKGEREAALNIHRAAFEKVLDECAGEEGVSGSSAVLARLAAVESYSFAAAATDVLKKHIEELEARLAEVEGKGIKFTGTYQRAGEYARGDVVVHSGCSWVALKAVQGEAPGASDAWQMMTKAGRDARR